MVIIHLSNYKLCGCGQTLPCEIWIVDHNISNFPAGFKLLPREQQVFLESSFGHDTNTRVRGSEHPGLPTWSFLWSDDKRGRLRPPFFAVRYNRPVLAECASPVQCFRYLEARASKLFSTHETGNSLRESSQVRRGHTLARYIRSFCLRERGQASILVSISSILWVAIWTCLMEHHLTYLEI